MATISNCAEGGTDGVTPSSSNSGGVSGTALDTQTIGSGCTLTFSSAAAYAGSLGYRHVMPSGNVSNWQRLNGLSAAGRVVIRLWFKISSVPTVTDYLFSLRSASAQVCVMAIGTDGKLVMQNAAGAGITSGANGSSASSRATNALAADTWYRLEASATKGTTTSNGSLEYAYYLGDSSTAEFSWTGTTNVNAGTANITSARLGRTTSVASSEARTIDLDGVFMTELASGWVGPDVVLAPTGIATAEAFGTPVVTIASGSVTVSPTGIASIEAHGTATLASTLAISPAGVDSAEALGSPTLSAQLTTSPAGIASAEAFGTPTIVTSGAISPSGVPSEEAVGTPELGTSLSVGPAGVASGQAFGSPTIGGSLAVSPFGITTQEGIGTPTVILDAQNQTISPSGIASGQAMGTPSLTKPSRTVSPSGIPSLESVNPVKLSTVLVFWPTSILSAQAFGSPTVTHRRNVSVQGIPSEEAFGSPTLSKNLTVSAQGIESRSAIGTVKLRGPGLSKHEYELSGELARSRNRGTIGDPSTTVQTPARWEGSLG